MSLALLVWRRMDKEGVCGYLVLQAEEKEAQKFPKRQEQQQRENQRIHRLVCYNSSMMPFIVVFLYDSAFSLS